MKNLFLLLLLFSTKIAFSQYSNNLEITNSFDSLTVVNTQQIIVINKDIKKIKSYVKEYHTQIINGYMLYGIGASTALSSIFMEDIKVKKGVIIAGSIFSLIGVINNINALKWLKYISSDEYGIGIKFNLN